MKSLYAELPIVSKELLKRYTNHLRGKRLSTSTIKSYGYFCLRFLYVTRHKPIEDLNREDIDHFFINVLAKENYSISSHRQSVSALKYLADICQVSNFEAEHLKRPKPSKQLPTVLSSEEIIDLMQVTKNLKHRTIIGLLYSCGLRIGELLSLKRQALDFDRNLLYVHQGKGRKDRVVIMSHVLKPLVFNYLNSYRPKVFVFEGQKGGPYAAVSVRKFLKRSCELAGIKKRVTPHVLRHSYATHLLENGVDLRYIQVLLGHAKPETTMIYTHVAQKDITQIESPLDKAVASITKTNKGSQKVLLSGNRIL